MAVTDVDKTDFLWKKVIFGVAKTASETAKFGSNETIASPLPVYANQIWAQTDSSSIPSTPPGSTTGTVSVLTGAARIRCTSDPTAAPNRTWLATTTFGTISSQVGDFIPPTFGTGYAVRVFIGNPNGGPAARIFPDTTNEEWVFDYQSGTLHFVSGVPANRTATIGTAVTVSVATDGIYIEAFRYVGQKGVVTDASKVYVVANITARNALTGLNAGDIAHVVDASGIAADAGSGEYANYLWTGSVWRLISTQDSARTDALTQSVNITGPLPGSPTAIGVVGTGTRVVNITVEVTTPFDGTAAITIGDSADNDRLVIVDEVDLQSAGTYVAIPSFQYSASAETTLNVYYSGTATTGAATVTMTYA
jgi:hypothetical protein